MEIFSYITHGCTHTDSLGNSKTVTPGIIQLMSNGTAITHSEFNPSSVEITKLLQIWIKPARRNLTPSYTEWKPSDERRVGAKK